MKINKLIPRPVKNAILRIVRFPERIKWKIYRAASLGKIPFPDKAFQKWDYKIHTGRRLHLQHPVTYQEKLQWLKYYYRNPAYTRLVDKYEVREWVADKIGEEYLCPIYGIYDCWDEIDFSQLPEAFVLKCTHDSGSVVICKDKTSFDFEQAKEKIETGLKRKQFYLSREWPYKNVKPRILCEKYLIDERGVDSPDYKFFCFDGEIRILETNSERQTETGTKTDFYSPEFQHIEMRETGFPNSTKIAEPPMHFDKMKKLAQVLSAGMPHVRVDFNYVNDQIFFGEMTFYHGGGRMLFEPDEWNYRFGEWITLPPKMR